MTTITMQQPPAATTWHFKIIDPELTPGDNFADDIIFSLRKLSKLVALDEYTLTYERAMRVAKVRLQRSRHAVQQNTSLEDGVKHLCKAMVGTSNRRPYVESLTKRSIFGIEPESRVFRTYWTASFFNGVLAQGPQVMHGFAEDIREDYKPYIAPTALVFGVAIIAGIIDGFPIFSQLYNQAIPSAAAMQTVVEASLPTAEKILKMASTQLQKPNESKTLKGKATAHDQRDLETLRVSHNHCLAVFKTRFDNFLQNYASLTVPSADDTGETLRHNIWMFTICSDLCGMMEAASKLLSDKAILGKVMQARNHQLSQAGSAGVFSLFSAAVAGSGVSSLVPLATSATSVSAAITAVGAAPPLAPVMLAAATSGFTAFHAYKYFSESKELKNEYERLRLVFSATSAAWNSAFKVHVVLQTFQLRLTSSYSSEDDELQKRWEGVISNYDDVTREFKSRGYSDATILPIFVDLEVVVMKDHRKLLD